MKNFFYLNRSDRKVMTALLAAVIIAVALIIRSGANDAEALTGGGDTPGEKVKAVYNKGEGGWQTIIYDEGRRVVELFPFDPNTADSTRLLRLGLSKWQVRSIYRYRAAGGIYRSKEDFARLRSLTRGQYRQLEPYIHISEDYAPAAEAVAAAPKDEHYRDTTRYPLKLREGQQIALNTTDTALLKRVPGIGSGFANAIVRYRERLGGFYSTDQLREIDGFPETAIRFFTADNERTSRLNINTLPLGKLRRHPYIGFYRAKTIIDHRRIHGRIGSLSELGIYADFPAEVIERLRHYVEL